MDPVTLSEAAADRGLAILLYGVLSDAARRHGDRLPGLCSRIGFVATDAADEVTLILCQGRCVIEAGLAEPDLVLAASSALLPQLQALPTVLGLPLTVYAAAFFVVTLTLAGATLLSPGLLRPLLRPTLVLLAWAALLVCALLEIGRASCRERVSSPV